MKNCFKAFVFAAVLLTAFAPGCTEVDDTLGYNLLPSEQGMEFKIETFSGIDSYLAISDSIPFQRTSKMLIGNFTTDGFGSVRTGAALQYYFYGYGGADDMLHNYPIPDSVELVFNINKIYGDTKVAQKFYVYELTEDLSYEEAYYSDVVASDIADLSKPVFSFTLENELTATEISKKLDWEAGAQDYLNRLVLGASDNYDMELSEFRKNFKGFYIAPSPLESEAPSDAAIYEIYLIDSEGIDNINMVVHVHNHQDTPKSQDDIDEDADYDDYTTPHNHGNGTMYLKNIGYYGFSFEDTSTYTDEPNTSIIIVENDHSANVSFDPSVILDNPEKLDTNVAVPVTSMKVQGLAGVYTYLYFTDELIESIRSQRLTSDGKEAVIMVNRAMLYIYLDVADAAALDNAPTRLGMYYDLKGTYPTAIPDYLYYEESYYGYTFPYGGNLDRSQKRYEMNISTYMQRLLDNPDQVQREVWLAPAVGATFYSPTYVSLNNSGDETDLRHMKLEVAYSLLKTN